MKRIEGMVENTEMTTHMANDVILIDVKQTPGGAWVNIGNGWMLAFRFPRDIRARIRHARMCKGKHGAKRPR